MVPSPPSSPSSFWGETTAMDVLSWLLYVFLILFRIIVCPLLKGYVHPDEFYQGKVLHNVTYYVIALIFVFVHEIPAQFVHGFIFSIVKFSKYCTKYSIPIKGGQELFFGCSTPTGVPWEYEPHNALRSILPPAIMTAAPIQMYSTIKRIIAGIIVVLLVDDDENNNNNNNNNSNDLLSGMELLIIPRIFCSLLSIITVDWSVWSICITTRNNKSVVEKSDDTNGGTARSSSSSKKKNKKNSSGVPVAVLLLASAWPSMVLLSRPFSNTMECIILAILLAIVLTYTNNNNKIIKSSSNNNNNKYDIMFGCKVGIICAVGIFTRFTFVFFSFPVLLYLLVDLILQHTDTLDGSNTTIRKMCYYYPVVVSVSKQLLWIVLSFVITAYGIISMDTQFYLLRGRKHSNGHDGDDINNNYNAENFIVTPWNALTYNSKISNLMEHGLHPRYTHAVVNMMIMFGPLSLVTYYTILSGWGGGENNKRSSIIGVDMVLQGIIVFGLGLLSVAPHQEPRFLLPLITPMVLLGEKYIKKFPTTGTVVWIVFNSILFILFGILHQGGVVQSLLMASSTAAAATTTATTTSWVYWRTYMPPSFLTRASFHNSMLNNGSPLKTCGGTIDEGFCGADFAAAADDDVDVDGGGSSSNFDYNNMMMCPKPTHRIIDLNGSSIEKLWDTIQSELSCSRTTATTMENNDTKSSIFLIVPFLNKMNHDTTNHNDAGSGTSGYFDFSSIGDDVHEHGGGGEVVVQRCKLPNEAYDCIHVRSYGPHLTTEDFPLFQPGSSITNFYRSFVLNVYNISCIL